MAGITDTYLKSDSYRSDICIFNPLANISSVSMRGIVPLQIPFIADFETPDIFASCREVSSLSIMISLSRILIHQLYSLDSIDSTGNLWEMKMVDSDYSGS